MKEIVKVSNLYTAFGSKVIHDNISFAVNSGEIFAILGASGSGKSVLLREMLMLMEPKSGDIDIFGKNLKNLSSTDMEELRKSWGVLFQFGALYSSLTVFDNIAIVLKEYTKLSQDLISDIVYSKLKLVGLASEVAFLYPNELSGGMVKRVALARALALDAKLLFLDEPTSGLDPVGARNFDKLIVSLKEILNVTIIMVTHDLDSIFTIADNMIVLADKKIVASGTLQNVLKSKHPFVEEFFKNDYVQKRYQGGGKVCITK